MIFLPTFMWRCRLSNPESIANESNAIQIVDTPEIAINRTEQ